MIPQTNFNSSEKEILNFNEACTYLDLSKSYMYKLTHSRLIPHFKPNGKKLYFKSEDLKNYLLKNRVLTQSEIQVQAEEKLDQIRGAK